MYQKKFEHNQQQEALDHAKKREAKTGKQHYVIMVGRLQDMGYYVEDETPFIRPAFETLIYPK